MGDFVSVGITVDPSLLLDRGIDSMNANLTANGFPNWTPADASMAVILMGVVAQWAADNAQTAATAADAIFRGFGTQLIDIPPITGAFATVSTTWTFTTPAPTGGYTISAGTGVLIDGFAFYVQTTVVTATSATTATVTLVASQPGAAYNSLGGISVGSPRVVPVDELDWVSSIVTTTATSGGADQESDDDYESRLSSQLQLMRLAIVTAADYPLAVTSLLCQEQSGVTVGRATAIDGWYPAPRALSTGGAGSTVLSCTTTNASPTVTIVTTLTTTVPAIGATVTGTGIPGGTTVAATPAPTLTSFTLSANATTSATNNLTIGSMSGYGPTNLSANCTLASGSPNVTLVTPPYTGAIPAYGATITGASVPANTTILSSPAPTATSFTMSANATGNQTAQPYKISEWTTIARCVTTFVTDAGGAALTAAQMDAVATWLGGFREANFLVFVSGPSYTTIYVTAEVHVLPGYDATAVVTAAQTAVVSFLSPATFGNPSGAATFSSSWLNYTQGFAVVRYNDIVGVLKAVPGVQYVPPGSSGLAIGTSPSPSGTSDIALSGPAPLPLSDNTTVLVTAV